MKTILRNIIFLSLCFLAFKVEATVNLPEDVTIDTIISGFRDDFISKILQITTNYSSPPFTSHTAVFNATKTPVVCKNGKYQPVGAQVSKIVKTNQIILNGAAQQMTETITYYGCDGKIAFSETVTTDGLGLKPLDWPQIFKGKREFALRPYETRRIVSFADDREREFIGFTTLRQENVISSNFTYYSQPVLNILEIRGDDLSQLVFTLGKYSVSPVVDFAILPTSQFTSSKNIFTIQAFKNEQTQYRTPDQKLTSKDTFFLDLAKDFLFTTVNSMQLIFDSFIARFPPTVLVSTAAQNQRILLELQLAVTQLNSGLQINQVKILLQSYIAAINNGQLDVTDLRPKN